MTFSDLMGLFGAFSILHTMFNIITHFLLLPVGTWMTKVAKVIFKDKGEKETDDMLVLYLLDIKHINTEKLGPFIICMEGIKKEFFVTSFFSQPIVRHINVIHKTKNK